MRHAVSPDFDPANIQKWINSEVSAGRLNGGVLEILRSGETVFSEAFGIRGADGLPVTRDTQFWIASMTKPIVSAAAMKLVENGYLTLCDPVQRFVPGLGAEGVLLPSGQLVPVDRPPTILDLMIHTSGVTYGFLGGDDIHRRYREAGVYDFRIDNKEMAERLASLPLLHQPGQVFEYGMSTDLLGRVIEVVTKLQLDDALEELVLAPLKMHNTEFVPKTANVAELPPSPVRDAIAPLMSSDQSWWSGGAGLWTTVSDYMRFARMLQNDGIFEGIRLLQPGTLSLMCHNHLPTGVQFGQYTTKLGISAPKPENGLGFGLGLAVRTAKSHSVPGGIGEILWPGVSGANFWVDPENDLITVFLTHSPENRAAHRIGLREAVYAGLQEEKTP